jgi:hypothetical protein
MLRPAGQTPLKGRKLNEDVTHMNNGIQPLFGAAAVRSATARFDFRPGEPFVRCRHLEPGRFHHDGGVGSRFAKQSARSEAPVLFVGDAGEDHITLQPAGACQFLNRTERSGNPRLHIERPSTVEPAVFDTSRKGILHTRYAHCVQMTVEHQGRPAAAPGKDSDDVEPARAGLHEPRLDSDAAQEFGDEASDGLLTSPTRYKRGVDGVDSH